MNREQAHAALLARGRALTAKFDAARRDRDAKLKAARLERAPVPVATALPVAPAPAAPAAPSPRAAAPVAPRVAPPAPRSPTRSAMPVAAPPVATAPASPPVVAPYSFGQWPSVRRAAEARTLAEQQMHAALEEQRQRSARAAAFAAQVRGGPK